MSAAADPTPPKRRSSAKLIILVLVVALVALAGGAAAAWHFAGPSGEAPKPRPKAEYLALSPAFVVNLDETPGVPRYLQVEVQLVTRDPAAIALLQHHTPAIRAGLLMLFAQQTYDGLATREGKQALQAAALEEVQALMAAETGQPQVEALLFTSFVTQ